MRRSGFRHSAFVAVAAIATATAGVVIPTSPAQAMPTNPATALAFGLNTFDEASIGSTSAPNDVGAPVILNGSTPGTTIVQSANADGIELFLDNTGQIYETNNTGDHTAHLKTGFPNGVRFTKIVGTAGEAMMALDTNGNAWAWGTVASSPTTNGTASFNDSPIEIPPPSGVTFTDLATDGQSYWFVGSDGHVYSSGQNSHGELGDACALGGVGTFSGGNFVTVAGVSNAVAVTAGSGFAIFTINAFSTVHGYEFKAVGNDGEGELGDNSGNDSATYCSSTPSRAAPNLVTTDGSTPLVIANLANVSANLYTVVAAVRNATGNSTPYTWGGDLTGLSSNGINYVATQVYDPNNVLAGGLLQVAVGDNKQALGITPQHQVVGWGRADNGLLLRPFDSSLIPTLATATILTGKLVSSVNIGINDAYVLYGDTTGTQPRTAGSLVASGSGGGNFAYGANNSCPCQLPVYVQTTAGGHNPDVVQAVGGNLNTIWLNSAGQVWAEGFDQAGQTRGLGPNGGSGFNNNDQTTPFHVLGPNNELANVRITSISSEGPTVAALDDTGHVYVWGTLAWNTVKEYPLPGDVKVKAIAAGQETVAALTDTGQVYTLGYNGYGELGNGAVANTFTSTWTKVNLSLSPGWVSSIGAGNYSMYAVVTDGSAVVVDDWGRNEVYELGRPTSGTDPTANTGGGPDGTPAEVSQLDSTGQPGVLHAGASNVAYTYVPSSASQPTTYVWGDLTFAQEQTPVQLQSLPGFSTLASDSMLSQVFGGLGNQLALRTDGKLLVWGRGGYDDGGQSNGTTITSPQIISTFPAGVSTIDKVNPSDGSTLIIANAPPVTESGSLDAGTQAVNSTTPLSITLTNNANDTLQASWSLGGANPTSWQLSGPTSCVLVTTCSPSVSFHPTSGGAQPATLTVTTNAVDVPSVTYTLTGSANGPSGIQSSTLTSDFSTLKTTATSVPISSLPLNLLPETVADSTTPAGRTPAGRTPAGRTDFAYAPAGRTPAGRTPAGRTPAGRTPAGRTGIGLLPAGRTPAGRTPAGRTPAGRTPAGRTPAGRTDIANVTLDQIPLFRPGGWSAVLDCYPTLKGATPQSVTYVQAYQADVANGGTGPLANKVYDPNATGCAAAITADQIDWAHSPFADISLLSILMGDVRMDQYSTVNWCTGGTSGQGQLTDLGTNFCQAGGENGDITDYDLMELEYYYISLDWTTVASTKLSDIHTDANSPTDPFANAAFPSITITDSNLTSTKFGPIMLDTLSPAAQANVVSCQVDVDANCDTLADAQTANLIKPTATYADLMTSPQVMQLRLLDLIETFIDPQSLNWEDLDLSKLDPNQLNANLSNLQRVQFTNTVVGACNAETGLTETLFLPSTYILGTNVSGGGHNAPSAYNLAESTNLPTGSPLDYTISSALPPGTANPPTGTTPYTFTFTNTAQLQCHSDSSFHLSLTVPMFPGFTYGSSTSSSEAYNAAFTGTNGTNNALSSSVTTQVVDPNETPGGGNNTEATAPTIAPDNLVVSQIATAGDVDYYKITIPPGKRVDIAMKPPAGQDYDLVVYGPADSSTGVPLRANDPFSVPFGQQEYVDPGQQQAEQTAASVLQGVPQLTDRPILAASALRSDEEEQVSFTSPESATGDEIIQVSGYNGAHSNLSYNLRVDTGEDGNLPACPVKSYEYPTAPYATTLLPTGTPTGNEDTVFLVDYQRLARVYGTANADAIVAKVKGLAQSGDPNIHVNGVVIQVDADPAVRAATDLADQNSCDPGTQDQVVRAINNVVDNTITAPGRVNLRNLVVVGTDEIIPFARVEDRTRDANERGFTGDALFDGNNSIAGTAGHGYYLSDDPYGSLNPIGLAGRTLYLPQIAIGRLGETPAEIEGQIDQFMTYKGIADPRTTSANPLGRVSGPRSALVTDYSFLQDGGAAEVSALSSSVSSVQHLTGATWTRTDLINALFGLNGGTAPAIAALNAHYDQYRAVPADEDANGDLTAPFTTADISSDSLPRRIIYTIGCHSGLNVPDDYGSSLDTNNQARLKDFAQAYADAGAAVMVGNLGYGIGDTTTVGYGEKLFADFSSKLDGTYTVGGALLQAKRDYLLGLQAYAPYDEKVLQETVLWGLPMYRVINTNPQDPGSQQVSTDAITDNVTGLDTANIGVTAPVSRIDDGNGYSHFESTAGVQSTNGYPLIPIATTTLPKLNGKPSSFVHSIVPIALTSHAEPIKNTFSQVSVDNTTSSNPPYSDADFPITLGALQTVRNANGTVDQTLVSAQGQFRTDGNSDPQTGIFRTFTSSQWKAYYSPSLDTIQPAITSVSATGTSTINAVVSTNGGSAIKLVYAMARLDGNTGSTENWALVPMTLSNGTYTGTANGTVDEFLIFAINASGNAGQAYQKGTGTTIQTGSVTPATVKAAPAESPNTNGYYHDAQTISILGDPTNTYKVQIDGGTPVPSGATISTDGTHTVQLIDPSGNPSGSPFTVKIDQTAPILTVNQPVDNATYYSGTHPSSSLSASDAGSGIDPTLTDVSAPLDMAPGGHTVTFTAVDKAGNVTQVVRHYTVIYAVLPTADHAPNAAGWYKDNVSVSVPAVVASYFRIAVDGVSSSLNPVLITTEGKHVVTLVDNQGANVLPGPNNTLNVWIDKTAPVITSTTIYRPTLHSTAYAAYTATDSLSGGATAVDSLDNNAPNSFGALDTSVITLANAADKTFTITATDLAGNVATKTVSYRVIYASTSGLLSPVNPASNTVNLITSLMTVPFNYKVFDALGHPVANAVDGNAITATLASCPLLPVNSALDPTGLLGNQDAKPSYNASTNTYTWHAKVYGLLSGVLPTNCYRSGVTLNDGYTKVQALFRILA